MSSDGLQIKGLDAVIAQQEYDAWGGGSHSANYEGGSRSNRNAKSNPGTGNTEASGSTPPPAVVGPDKVTTEARKMKAVYGAKKDELTYKKMAGELVDKQAVYSQLYTFGDHIKKTMQAIPARVIDSILAAPNRNTAKNILFEEISSALEKIGQAQEKIKIK